MENLGTGLYYKNDNPKFTIKRITAGNRFVIHEFNIVELVHHIRVWDLAISNTLLGKLGKEFSYRTMLSSKEVSTKETLQLEKLDQQRRDEVLNSIDKKRYKKTKEVSRILNETLNTKIKLRSSHKTQYTEIKEILKRITKQESKLIKDNHLIEDWKKSNKEKKYKPTHINTIRRFNLLELVAYQKSMKPVTQ